MKQILLEKFSTRESDNPLWPCLKPEKISDSYLEGPGDKLTTVKTEYADRLDIRMPKDLGFNRIDGTTGMFTGNCEEVSLYLTKEFEKVTGVGRLIRTQSQFIMEQHDAIIQLDRLITAHEGTIDSMEEYVELWKNTPWWKLIIMGLTKWM